MREIDRRITEGMSWPVGGAGRALRRAVPVPFILRMLVLVFVFSTIFDSFTFSFLDKSDNMAQVVGIVLAAFFLAFRGTGLRFREKDLRWFLVFFVVTAIEEGIRYAILSPAAEAISFQNYFSYFQVFVLYVIVRDLSRDPRVFRGVMAVFVVTYLSSSFLMDLGVQVVTAEVGERVGLAGVNLNAFAFALALVVAGTISWALSTWPRIGRVGWLLLFATLALVPALARTGSRGGAITLVFGIFVAILLNVRMKRAPVYLLLVPLVLAAVLHVLMSTEVMQRRIEATLYGHDYGSRVSLAQASLKLFVEDPWIGTGPAYMAELGRAMGWNHKEAAHNTYLQLVLSFGIFGLIPFLVGVVLTLGRVWMVRGSPVGGIWLTTLAMTFLFALSGHLGYDKTFWIILALAGNVSSVASQGAQTWRTGVRMRSSRGWAPRSLQEATSL